MTYGRDYYRATDVWVSAITVTCRKYMDGRFLLPRAIYVWIRDFENVWAACGQPKKIEFIMSVKL